MGRKLDPVGSRADQRRQTEQLAVHQTHDPEAAIVELATTTCVGNLGQSFSTRSISVFHIRDGAIVLFSTYSGPAPSLPSGAKS